METEIKIYFGCFCQSDSRWFFYTSPHPTNSTDESEQIGKFMKFYLLELLVESRIWNYGFNTVDGEPFGNIHTIEADPETMAYIYKTLLDNGCVYSSELNIRKEDVGYVIKRDEEIIDYYNKYIKK